MYTCTEELQGCLTIGQASPALGHYLARASASLCCSACISELSDKLTLMWLFCRPAELCCCCCSCCCCCCCCCCCMRCCWVCRACVSLWSAASLSSRRVRATAAATSSLPAPVTQTTTLSAMRVSESHMKRVWGVRGGEEGRREIGWWFTTWRECVGAVCKAMR